jgi:hypothetical protein
MFTSSIHWAATHAVGWSYSHNCYLITYFLRNLWRMCVPYFYIMGPVKYTFYVYCIYTLKTIFSSVYGYNVIINEMCLQRKICALYFGTMYWVDWFSSNVLDLYSGGAWFESQPGHQLSWLKFLVFFLIPSWQMQRYYLD